MIIEESYAWRGTLTKRTSATGYIILHHADADGCTAQDIHRWHLANGWTGIGYHYFVKKDGAVYRGRPYDTIGAHCTGFNSNSVGVCAEGRYNTQTMPEVQKAAIVQLCRELLHIYPLAQIVGHGNCLATSCPGANYPLTEIQKEARESEAIEMEAVSIKIGTTELGGILLDGKSLGPVRDICEALGAKVDWDSDTKTVTVSMPDDYYKLLTENNELKQLIKQAHGLLAPAALL